MASSSTYAQFIAHLQKIADINYAAAVLVWDKETNLPPGGAGLRARQTATLAGMAHELFTDPKTGALLDDLEQDPRLSATQRRNVEEVRRDYDRATKFDSAFVERMSRLSSAGYHAWAKARDENDFSHFEPALADLVEIKREAAGILRYDEHPYDALLDEFEPGYRTAQVEQLFADVRSELVDFAREVREKSSADDSFLDQHFPHDQQWAFGLEILRRLGYDFDTGRQDKSRHPFTISFGARDVRVTTVVNEQNFSSMVWSTIHEAGHALYEQGLPAEQYGLPLGQSVSLGIHESQSRLWENNVGRGRPFWEANLPLAKSYFPEQFKEVELPQFLGAINRVFPSPIRIESDELHYHFHIMIRFEIEKALIEGSLTVKDVPQIWNEKYKQYLDLDIADDNQGCLQDIHWSSGSFGYFPTYSLGSFYAAQFYAQAKKDITGLEAQIAAGNNQPLLDWLRDKIHRHGKRYSANELCTRITGETLNFKYFMDYARQKYP